jgi:CheY-like chemotaxis protein
VSDAHQDRAVRVLVVDDEFVVRDFVSRTLRHAGYQTETASDSRVALRMADASSPLDLLVTDLKMPGMSGSDLADAFLRNDASVKVLFLTGYAESLVERAATPGSRQAVLGKPCTVTELLHAVSLILFGHIRGLTQYGSSNDMARRR